MFCTKEIVWAKVKKYPWWPAEIVKLPSLNHNCYKVTFIGQNNHALLQQKSVKKYQQNYSTFKLIKYRGLQPSIEQADQQLKKRNPTNPVPQPAKASTSPLPKVKKLRKKPKQKRPQRVCPPIQSQKKQSSQQSQQREQQSLKDRLGQNQESNRQELLEVNQSQFVRIVDRRKIQAIEAQLFNYIKMFNHDNYNQITQCLVFLLAIQQQEFKPEELVQSKITNMITYILKNITQRTDNDKLIHEQLEQINIINIKLKQSVIDFLFNMQYYEQFLKKMKIKQQKSPEKQSKNKTATKLPLGKHLYKRKLLLKKRQNAQSQPKL